MRNIKRETSNVKREISSSDAFHLSRFTFHENNLREQVYGKPCEHNNRRKKHPG